MIYGQTTTININPDDQNLTPISSYLIGVCRDHATYEHSSISNFNDKMEAYRMIAPRFGKKKKLYRLGGSPYDGNNNNALWAYPGYFWPTVDYQEGGDNTTLPGGVTSPFDNFPFFVAEANQIEADMIVPINVVKGSLVEANLILDYLFENNLMGQVAFFELGNELYGTWQLGHNMYGCSAERYGNRAAHFIDGMMAHANSKGYDKNLLKFALMGSFDGSWGAFGSILRIADNENNNYEVDYRYTGSYYTNFYYEWHLSDGSIANEHTKTITTSLDVTDVTIFFYKDGPIYEHLSWDESCEDHSPVSSHQWLNNPDQGSSEIIGSYLNNVNLLENDHPKFHYIAYHNYADGYRFVKHDYNYDHDNDALTPAIEAVLCDGQWVSGTRAFKNVMALNSVYENLSISGIFQNLTEKGIKLVNTEYGSIGITGNNPYYSDGQQHKLNKTITEALFTADQILSGVKYGMAGATAFSLFHTTDGGDNIFFPITEDTSYPSYFAQNLIAQNLGNYYMGSSTHSNMTQTDPELCNGNQHFFDDLGYAATKDANGTIRILLINRSNSNIDINVLDLNNNFFNNYTSILHSYHGSSILDAPTQLDIPLNVDIKTVTTINALSVNVLVMTPMDLCATCTDYVISQNTTWPHSAYPGPYGKVVVNNGATLTINAEYEARFCTEGSIQIKSGGVVNLNGTLTSCDTDWGGVRLGPGARFTGDGGTISNARRAIQGTMFTQGPIGFNVPAPRIICNNMDFLNNEIGLYILDAGWYANPTSGPNTAFTPSNTSLVRLTDCAFDVSTNLNFQSHVVLRNTGKTTLSGCDFAYSQINARNFSSRGIFASNSRFTVKANGMSDPSSFSDLAKGIEVIQAYRPSAYVVEDSQFDRCAVGIHNMGTTGGKILRNQFNMGDMDDNYYAEDTRQIGVSFEGATNGIVLEENTFKNTEQTGKTVSSTYGTTARDLWPNDANVIRNNTFTDMAYANWAEGFSGDLDVGLHYLCNDHTNPIVRGWNFIAMDPTELTHNAMRIHQGKSELGGLQYAPARNTFSQIAGGSGGADNLRDFWVTNGIGTDYTYYYWTGAPLEEPIYENVGETPDDNASGNTCPRPFENFGTHLVGGDKDEVRNKYFEHRKEYDLSKEILETGTAQEQELAQKTVAYHRQQMDATAYAGYMLELSDTIIARDSIRMWMRRFDNKTGDYMLAADYLTTKEYEMSSRVLEMMQLKYEMTEKELMDYENMVFLYDALAEATGDSLSVEVLGKMEVLAESGEGQACYFSRQLLTSDYGYFFHPIITQLPEQYQENNQDAGGGYTGPKVLVSPNPTDYHVHFDWSAFATSGKEVVIEVTNQTGGLIAVLKPIQNSVGMDWTTEQVTGNSCYYRLLVGGLEVYGGQIVINK